ncbi:MAG: protocatechuate 3,4-dioxygenase subunit alpha [Antricoccus sp.]
MADLSRTPGQTVGPFFGYALPFSSDSELVAPSHPDAIRLHGHVIDGAGNGVPDALIEIWQRGPDGAVVYQPGSMCREGYSFTGWGRAATDPDGHYSFSTIMPAAGPAGAAPMFAVCVFARGLLDRLFTRAYVATDDSRDAFLDSLEHERRETLIVRCDTDRSYIFDIVLQGAGETVFLKYS